MYINPIPNENGGYSNAQSHYVKGLVFVSDEQLKMFHEYNGFVNITVENDIVVTIEPNIDAWNTWKEWETSQPVEPEEPKSDMDEIAEAIRKGVNSI